MSIQLNERRLAAEIARRGWDQATFAAIAGITTNTVSSVMRGKPVRQAVLQKMVIALQNAPIIEQFDALIADRVPV